MRRRADLPGRALALPALLAVGLLALPLLGLIAMAPWGRVIELMASAEALDALRISLLAATAAAALAFLLGLPLAVWLVAGSSRLRDAVRLLVLLPMVLPPVVGGVALLLAFGRRGLVGAPLGLELPFSTAGVVLAAVWVALPFFVLSAEAGLRGFDRRYADAASTLGAGRWRVFLTVTLPIIAPALRAGVVVAFARALGEFGATVTFAGNLAGETRTLPLAVHSAMERDPEAAVALSLLMVFLSVLILLFLRGRWLPNRA